MNRLFSILFLTASTHALANYQVSEDNVRNPKQTVIRGVENTPKQPKPNDAWHIHDSNRPQPPVAKPLYDGEIVPPPSDAKILFDGTNLDQWKSKEWSIIDGAMKVPKKKINQFTKEKFGDMHLHIEWMIPVGIKGWGQRQGNSGVFLMGVYEVQVLNCWANRTYPDGMTGAIYAQQPPNFNACKKPGEWQSYDIHFKAPVFKDGQLLSPAYITVYHNGVKIHDNYEIKGQTTYKQVAKYTPHANKDVIKLQHHGNPNMFRNIWVAPLTKTLGPKK